MHSRSEATATADDNSGKEQRFQLLFHSEAEAGPTKIAYEAPRTSLFGDPPPGPLWDPVFR